MMGTALCYLSFFLSSSTEMFCFSLNLNSHCIFFFVFLNRVPVGLNLVVQTVKMIGERSKRDMMGDTLRLCFEARFDPF